MRRNRVRPSPIPQLPKRALGASRAHTVFFVSFFWPNLPRPTCELALKVELTKNKTLGPGRHRRFGGIHQWEGEPCLACELGTRGSTF